jgi:hypothetical protein
MKGLALNSLRVGKKYRLINYGDRYEFELLRILTSDFELKDLHTLERYQLKELTKFGKGPDFEIREIEKLS